MSKLGKELNSRQYWAESGMDYVGKLTGSYHSHRLNVIRALIPTTLFGPHINVFDFGCGDAVLFPWFLEMGATISGVDISSEMVSLAKERLSSAGFSTGLVSVADVQFLESIPDASLDALLSFNVLAYLSDEEESAFYKHAQRILKPNGYLIVTHSNKLFDMFSLNRYTCEFFQENLLAAPYQGKIESLLVNSLKPERRTLYNVRENPLTYKHKLKEYGFQETTQHFINLHEAPPPLLAKDKPYPDTLSWPESDRWKLMFVCSTFGSCAIRL